MIQDQINSAFEGLGAVVNVINIRKLLQDKVVKGIHWGTVGFFAFWGYWNIYYYATLGQWWSMSLGACLAVANSVWLALALYFVRKQNG